MTLEEEVAQLRAENHALREALEQTQELLRAALTRIEELEQRKTPPPAFVNASVKKPKENEKKTRKKRDGKHNRARPRSEPTQIVEHRLVSCPNCHLRLGGITLARLREVIDVPVPLPVEITEHRIYKGRCAGCQKWIAPGEPIEVLVDPKDADHALIAALPPLVYRKYGRYGES